MGAEPVMLVTLLDFGTTWTFSHNPEDYELEMSHFVPAGAFSLHWLYTGRRLRENRGPDWQMIQHGIPGLISDEEMAAAILPWPMDGLLSSTVATELPHGIFSKARLHNIIHCETIVIDSGAQLSPSKAFAGQVSEHQHHFLGLVPCRWQKLGWRWRSPIPFSYSKCWVQLFSLQ